MAKHIPNILTIIRFVFIPFIMIAIFKEEYILALILLTISGITDVLDGYIARKYNFITDFGKLIDPAADKATQSLTLIALGLKQIIPLWIMLVIFVKEIISCICALLLYGKNLVVYSKWFGKLATVLFYAAIVLSMIINEFSINIRIDLYLYYIAVAISIFSFLAYTKIFFGEYKKNKETQTN